MEDVQRTIDAFQEVQAKLNSGAYKSETIAAF
jgi:hypothetical protein